jgi:hypothetical protein
MKQIIAIIAASLITAPASAYTAKDLRCVDRVMKKIVTEMAPTLVKKHGVRAVAGPNMELAIQLLKQWEANPTANPTQTTEGRQLLQPVALTRCHKRLGA